MPTAPATARVFPAKEFGLTANLSERTSRSDRQPRCAAPLARQYEVAFLTPSQEIRGFSCRAPAAPLFEDAFAAFARGTLIATTTGLTAIEDLLPGDMIQTASGPGRLLWLGNMELSLPRETLAAEPPKLTRIAADSFGLGRPMPDLLLGPRARILMRSPRCREMLGSTEAFAPADGFIDGVNVIELKPFASVSLYQLGFEGQQTILANGLEAESFHPGLRLGSMLERETLDQFLDLFPHIDGPDGFGPMPIPRLTSFEMERLRDGL